jgi:hypothetical protein
MEWIKTHDELPPMKKQGDGFPCLIWRNGEPQMAVWNEHYGSWDDASGDDHLCDAGEPSHWARIVGPLSIDALPAAALGSGEGKCK